MNNTSAPVTAFHDVPSAKAWLARQPLANPVMLQAALANEIGRLNQGTVAPGTRLQIMEFLREAVHFAQTECAKKFVGRALPLAPQEQASFDASRALWQLLGDGYRLCLEAAEAGDAECKQDAALLCHRALACAAMLQFDSYRAQHEVGSVFWQNLHRVYAAAERLACAESEVEDSLRVAGRSATPSAVYALVLVLFAASPYELSLRQVTALRRWLARWAGKVAVLHGPAPLNEAAALAVDLSGSAPTGIVPTPGPGLRWLDTGPMRNSIRGRLAKLKEGVSPAELQLGDDVSAEVSEELLLHLHRHTGRAAVPRAHPRRSTQGEMQLVSGFAGIHYHVSGKLYREPGTTSTISRQQANEMATLGRVSTAEEEARAAREFAPETWRLLDQSPGGLRLTRDTGAPQRRIGAGQLLALKGASDDSFLLAISRWLVAVGGAEINMGVMWLPGVPLGVTACSVERLGREQFERAFVLPEVERLQVPPSLILPLNAFRAPHEVELTNPPVGRMRLTRLLQRGLDYDRVELQPVS